MHQPHGITNHRLRGWNLTGDALEFEDVIAIQRMGDSIVDDARSVADHSDLIVFREVAQFDLEHEAVELCFRQGIGAFQLDRVLSGQHEERFRHLVGHPACGHLFLFHRFQQ